MVGGGSAPAAEGHQPQPGGVGGGEQGGQQTGDEHQPAGGAGRELRVAGRGVLGGDEDGFLGEEAGEGRDRGESEQRDRHRPEGVGDALGQAVHPGHDAQGVRTGGVDDHAGAEEEERLEGAVGQEVEHGGAAVTDGQGADHVAELADRRVGEHPLDVVLGDGGQAGADHRDGRHHGHDHQRGLGGREDGQEAGDEVDTGGDHGRGVDQRRDRGGARHGVGEPGVQGELRGLARDTGEQEQRDQCRVVESARGDGAQDLRDLERTGVGGEREQADQEGDVAELGDEEGLERGGAGRFGLPVVADQEVRADAHDLPADQQHHQVAGVDDEQHGGGEQ